MLVRNLPGGLSAFHALNAATRGALSQFMHVCEDAGFTARVIPMTHLDGLPAGKTAVYLYAADAKGETRIFNPIPLQGAASMLVWQMRVGEAVMRVRSVTKKVQEGLEKLDAGHDPTEDAPELN